MPYFYFFDTAFLIFIMWRKSLFSMNLLFRRLGPAFQHPCKRPNPTSARPLVQACHCSPSSHTQWNIVKPPRVPRDAVFNSRSQSRAMLDSVERKNAIPSFCDNVTKKFPLLYESFQRCTVFDRTFSYCFFSRRLFTQILQLSDLGG